LQDARNVSRETNITADADHFFLEGGQKLKMFHVKHFRRIIISINNNLPIFPFVGNQFKIRDFG
jgi:hypothetical protein